jgi:hypothetical protein
MCFHPLDKGKQYSMKPDPPNTLTISNDLSFKVAVTPFDNLSKEETLISYYY